MVEGTNLNDAVISPAAARADKAVRLVRAQPPDTDPRSRKSHRTTTGAGVRTSRLRLRQRTPIDDLPKPQSKVAAMTNTLLQTISALCSAKTNPALWPRALAQLAKVMGADAAFSADHCLSGSSGCITHSWGIGAKRLSTYSDATAAWTSWLQRNEFVASAPSVWMGEEFAVEGVSLARNTFAIDWLQAQGLHHVLIGFLESSSGAIRVAVLARGHRRGRFSAEAKSRLVTLLPYLQRNLAASEATRSTRGVEGAAIRALQVVALGVAIIRADGGVLFANAAANAAINNGDILFLRNGPLALGQPGRSGRFRELLTRLAAMIRDDKLVTSWALAVPRPAHRPLSLLVWPLPKAAAADSSEPVAIVFIGDPEHASEIDLTRLRDLYGLSRKEARVAALLAQGHTLDEMAQILGVVYETVRKHVKNIFSKTDTHRQADLVRMLVSGPAIVSSAPLDMNAALSVCPGRSDEEVGGKGVKW